MWPFDEVRAPELAHRDRPTVRAVLEVDHAVAKELNVVVGGVPARFRGKKNGGALSRQVARQGHQLLSKLMRVRRQVAKLGDGVDAGTLGLQPVDRLHDPLRGGLPLDVGGGEDVVSVDVREGILGRGEVENLDPAHVDPDGGRVFTHL